MSDVSTATSGRSASATSATGRTERRAGKKILDTLINVALILAVGFAILAYRLPIFSNILYVRHSVYNFGTVTAGTLVRHTFTVRNLHPWPVTVTDITGSCGCTRGFVGRKVPFRLGPLQSVAVLTTENTMGKSGDAEQSIHIATSDNKEGTLLVLQGSVQDH